MSLRRFVTAHLQGVTIAVLLAFGSCSKAMGTTDRFLVHPDDVVYAEEGSDVTFEWHFITQRKSVLQFLFGKWGYPGYVKHKVLNVQGYNEVNKRQGFEKKVDWSGNIYKCAYCKAKVTMYNLRRQDFKIYGVNIELSFDRRTLQHWLTLVKAEPARIINWVTNIEVQEGNATTIECKAKGLPPPHVKIVRRNRTLCNGTEHCIHRIEAAKSEDEGEYVCLVQQRNVSRQVRPYSMHLTVHQERKEKNRGTSASTPSTSPSEVPLVVVLVLVLACLLVVSTFLYRKVTKVYKFEKEEKAFEI